MNLLSRAYLRWIKGTNLRGGILATLLLGAGISLGVLILFMVGFRGTEWLWGLLRVLLERIKSWLWVRG